MDQEQIRRYQDQDGEGEKAVFVSSEVTRSNRSQDVVYLVNTDTAVLGVILFRQQVLLARRGLDKQRQTTTSFTTCLDLLIRPPR
jgi:hypothetical protein